VSWTDADLLGQLLDEFLDAPSSDAGPMVNGLANLADCPPGDPARPIWGWLAAWASSARELGEPVLALKIAAFTVVWREYGVHQATGAAFAPIEPSSAEYTEIMRSAFDASAALPLSAVIRSGDGLTVGQLLAQLRGETGPTVEPNHEADSAPRPWAARDDELFALVEAECPRQWEVMLRLLEEDERVAQAAPVLSYQLRPALLALTDFRLLIVSLPKYIIGDLDCAEIQLVDVLGARYRPGSRREVAGIRDAMRSLRQLVIESQVGDYSVTFPGGARSRDGAAWPNLIMRQKRAARAPDRPEAARTAAPPALADQLEKLGQLHQGGVLSAAEFAAAKARLLS
jgi:hypothetical protein